MLLHDDCTATMQTEGYMESLNTYLLSVVSVHLHQLAHIKSGGTHDLDLPHIYALERVDATALLLNVLTYNDQHTFGFSDANNLLIPQSVTDQIRAVKSSLLLLFLQHSLIIQRV